MNAKSRNFLDEFSQLVLQLYEAGDGSSHGEQWHKMLAYVQGFAAAGRAAALADPQQIQEAIDSAHMQIYGESRGARRQRLEELAKPLAEIDWDALEAPAFVRRKAP